MSRACAVASRLEQARWYVTRRRMVIAVTLDVSVGARHCARLRNSPLAPPVPADRPPILIARSDLARTPPRPAHALRLGMAYDTVLATGRVGRRRRGVARGSPLRRRTVARPGAPGRLARGAGRARGLDVSAGCRRLVTVPATRPIHRPRHPHRR